MSQITTTAQDNINNFKNYLLDNAFSENTAKGYCVDMKMYAEWYNNQNKDLNVIDRQDIINYKVYLRNSKRQDAKTINHKLCSIKKYNEYLIDIGAMDTSVVIKKDMCKVQAEFANPSEFTTQDITDFITAIKNDTSDKASPRNYAIVYLLAFTGLRISECINIQFRNLNLEEKELLVHGKGNKQRTVYLSDNLCNVLKDYITNNRTFKNYGEFVHSPYLFISNRSNKLTTSRMNQICHKYNKNIHPHSLRHFFCSNAYESGMLLHEIANQAGHANIQTTMRYTNPTKQELKNKMNGLHM